MPQRVLNSDWSDYDDKKKTRVDARFFACSEPWEVEYLVNKIHRLYPQHSKGTIKMAIQSCCRSLGTNHPRKEFVECVMTKL